MNTYETLGLRTIINADGMKTRWGGSLMPPEVVQAMGRAAGNFVDLGELHRAAGKRLAELIGSPAVEDVAVVNGAAAGLAVAAAACVAGKDGSRIKALPHLDWRGAKDQIVVPKNHITGYAQGFRNAGPRLVEVGGSEGATADEIAAAISERTAAVTVCGGELPGDGRFAMRASLAEVCEVAHSRGVPVIVDAAAELPPPENLRKFSERGADLVVFSGGKGIRGPQASGLILGKRELIEACRLNQNPNSSVGRPMKVGKEEICGVLKAVELYVTRDHAADLRYWESCAETVLDAVRDIEGVTGDRFYARTIAQARLKIDEARVGDSAAGLARRMRDGDPCIVVTQTGDALVINPHNLEPGEAEQIGLRLKQVLREAGLQPVQPTLMTV